MHVWVLNGMQAARKAIHFYWFEFLLFVFISIEIKIPYMFVQSPKWIVFVNGKVWIICHVVVNDLDIWITCARRRSKIEGHKDLETYPHRINAKILCTFRMYFERSMCTALHFHSDFTQHTNAKPKHQKNEQFKLQVWNDFSNQQINTKPKITDWCSNGNHANFFCCWHVRPPKSL